MVWGGVGWCCAFVRAWVRAIEDRRTSQLCLVYQSPHIPRYVAVFVVLRSVFPFNDVRCG